MRHHGWELPYHPLQVVAIAVFISLAFAFYVFFIPFLGSKVLEYHVIAIFSPLVLLVFALYIRCAAANPADPGIGKCREYGKMGSKKGSVESSTSLSNSKGARRNKGTSSSARGIDADEDAEQGHQQTPGLALKMLGFLCPCCVKSNSQRSRQQDELLYCSLCEAEIFKFSKHCRACDKCVDGFDHHCRWINNCIGRKNYKTFVSLMVTGLLLLVLEWSVGIYVIVRCLLNRREFQDNIISKLGSSFSLVPFIVVVGLCSILALLATFPLGQLFFFHLILIHKGISTYDYIVAMRERDQLQGEMQSLQSSPVSSVATAMSGMSSHGALQIHSRRPWCTPPRLLVEHQDTLVKDPSGDLEQGKEIVPIPSKKEEAPKKTKKAPVKINPWKLARLNAEDASKAADRAREKSSVLKPLANPNEPSVITETDSSGEIFSRSPAAEIVPFPARKTKRKRDMSPAVGKEVSSKPPLFKQHRDKKLPSSSSDITSGKHSRKKSIGSDDSVAPLQLEARSAFGSTTPGSSSAIAPSTSLLSPDESFQIHHHHQQQQQQQQQVQGQVNGGSSPGQFSGSRPWLQRSVSDGYEASGGESADDSEHGRRLAHAWNRLKQSSTFMNRGAMPPAPWVNVNKLRLAAAGTNSSSNIEANILKHVSMGWSGSRIDVAAGGGLVRGHSSEESNSSASQYNSPDRDSDFFSAGDGSNRRQLLQSAAAAAAGVEKKNHHQQQLQNVSRSGSLKAGEDQ